MEQKFNRHDVLVPEHIMEVMRRRRYLDKYDTSEDEEILKMSGIEFLDEWLGWEGIIGYTYYILEVIEIAFGINLEDWPFDETIKREVGDGDEYEI